MRVRNISVALIALAVVAAGFPAAAAVSVTVQPTSMVTTPVYLKASSSPLGVLSFSLNQTAGETLSSVAVTVANAGTSAATGADLASIQVYKDNGDDIFSTVSDSLAGTQTTVNIGSPTMVTTTVSNTLTGGKFYVAVSTGASWSSAVAPADSITLTLGTDGIVTSANSPIVVSATTAAITADTVGPVITSAIAKNTGGSGVKEAGDSIELTFGEPTNKPTPTASAVSSSFTLSGGHTLLDGLGVLTAASWNPAGTVLTVTLSSNVSLPTVEPGDTVTVAGSLITDAIGNVATGTTSITGSFTLDNVGPQLVSAVAQNTGGTGLTEAGDSVVLTFSEATTKPAITAANIASAITLNNGHTFLDGAGALGATSWNAAGTALTITLSAGTSLPTVVVGDTAAIVGTLIIDGTANPATGSKVITGTFSMADTQGPVLMSAIAKNTGGTSAFEAGDTLELSFGEPTNKPVFTSATLASTFTLSGGHSLLDGAGTIGSAAWNGSGTILVITFSAGTSLPTAALGDTVTVQGSLVTDALGNVATGGKKITGTFGSTVVPTPGSRTACSNGLINGRLYRIPDSHRVYLAANCNLKIFKGHAVGKARGNKFRDIITLSSLNDINVRSSAFRDDRPAKLEQEKNKDKKSESEDDDDDDRGGQSGNRGNGRGKKD